MRHSAQAITPVPAAIGHQRRVKASAITNSASLKPPFLTLDLLSTPSFLFASVFLANKVTPRTTSSDEKRGAEKERETTSPASIQLPGTFNDSTRLRRQLPRTPLSPSLPPTRRLSVHLHLPSTLVKVTL
jgi:hypothetical protein